MKKIFNLGDAGNLVLNIRRVWGQGISIDYEHFDNEGKYIDVTAESAITFDKIALQEAKILSENGGLK